MRTNDAFPGGLPDPDSFCAFDDDVVFPRIHSRPDGEYIGGVHLETSGPKRDLWRWSMTVSLAGPAFGMVTNGTTETRVEVSKAMLACYRRYLATRPRTYWKPGREPA